MHGFLAMQAMVFLSHHCRVQGTCALAVVVVVTLCKLHAWVLLQGVGSPNTLKICQLQGMISESGADREHRVIMLQIRDCVVWTWAVQPNFVVFAE